MHALVPHAAFDPQINVLGNDFMKERTKDEILKIIDKLPGGKEILEQAKSLIEITQAVVY